MKTSHYILLCLLLLCGSVRTAAQLPAAAEPAIFDTLRQGSDANGNPFVTIYQDPRIARLIFNKNKGITDRQSTKIAGYRVQVFSSNEQRTAKAEAFKVEKKMQEAFPDIQTYVLYQPPFWKVRLGDFRTAEEAQTLRQEVISHFPQMQGDVYPVKDQIQVIE